MLKNGTEHQDLGPDHFQQKAKTKKIANLINRLENLGFNVQIAPKAA
jgi:hypothetical protein